MCAIETTGQGLQGAAGVVAVRTTIGHHRIILPPTTYLEVTPVEIHQALGGALLVSAYKLLTRVSAL